MDVLRLPAMMIGCVQHFRLSFERKEIHISSLLRLLLFHPHSFHLFRFLSKTYTALQQQRWLFKPSEIQVHRVPFEIEWWRRKRHATSLPLLAAAGCCFSFFSILHQLCFHIFTSLLYDIYAPIYICCCCCCHTENEGSRRAEKRVLIASMLIFFCMASSQIDNGV